MRDRVGDTELRQTVFFPDLRDGDGCGAASGGDDGSQDDVNATIYRMSELQGLNREQLIAHADSLQSAYVQLENESRFQAWEFREFRENLTYFSRVAKLANQLNAASVETISDLAVNELPSYFNCRLAALFLYNSETDTLGLHAASGECPVQPPLSRDRDGEHFLFKLFLADFDPYVAEYDVVNQVVVPDGHPEFRVDIPLEWLEFLGHRALVMPLVIKQPEGEPPLLLGGMLVGNPHGAIELKDADISLIFGNLFSSSLHNAMLVNKLNAMTIIDPLTQIANRRHLLNQLGSAITHAKRQKHDLSIAMLDIDHFKRFNDNYGHLCGDKILRQFADCLKATIRSDIDIPARYGGEEFVIIMPYTGLSQAVMVAERIRAAVEDNQFHFSGKNLQVTCSIGVAENVRDESIEQFIDRADMVLYNAKRSGRNRVSAASSTIYKPITSCPVSPP